MKANSSETGIKVGLIPTLATIQSGITISNRPGHGQCRKVWP
jgi:hypothetical protein